MEVQTTTEGKAHEPGDSTEEEASYDPAESLTSKQGGAWGSAPLSGDLSQTG